MSEMISPAAARAAHVTDAVFYDFDMHKAPALLQDPHTRILGMLREAPPEHGVYRALLFIAGLDTVVNGIGHTSRSASARTAASARTWRATGCRSCTRNCWAACPSFGSIPTNRCTTTAAM